MNTQNKNIEQSVEKPGSQAKTIQIGHIEKPKQFAAVDMWNIQRQRKMIYRRSA